MSRPSRAKKPVPPSHGRGLVEGRIDLSARGFGFLVPDDAGKGGAGEDIFIPPRRLAGAMHGDRVRVAVFRRKSGKRWGAVEHILERAVSRLVGKVRKTPQGLRLVPYDNRLDPVRMENAGDASGGIRPGAVASARVTRYPDERSRELVCFVEEILGQEDSPGIDLQVILRKYGFPREFPADAARQAEALPDHPCESDFEGREDLRGKVVFTVDPAEARDFDDAVSVERLPSGNFLLGVHIADVAHYVAPHSPLDQEARLRGTSVYFPEMVLPMFPENLSNGLCSLKPNVPRLTQSVWMEITPRGKTVSARFADTLIESAARMIYEDAAAVMEGDRRMAARHRVVAPALRLMAELQKALASARAERGSLDFDLPEAKVSLTASGDIAGIVPYERTVAHRMIEECMLAANEAVAEHLCKAGLPSLYRIHEEPNPRKMDALREFLRTVGASLPVREGGVLPLDLRRVLARFEGRPEERIVSRVALRAMMLARYASENVGHFGLAAEFYTHFTSPIRRYPDLVVHRVLRLSRQGRKVPFAAELDDIALASSLAERRAEAAERELLQWKKVRFMADKIGRRYPAIISGVTKRGLYAELRDWLIEGQIPRDFLPARVALDEARHQMKSAGGKTWKLCDAITVEVARVDEDRREIFFRLADS